MEWDGRGWRLGDLLVLNKVQRASSRTYSNNASCHLSPRTHTQPWEGERGKAAPDTEWDFFAKKLSWFLKGTVLFSLSSRTRLWMEKPYPLFWPFFTPGLKPQAVLWLRGPPGKQTGAPGPSFSTCLSPHFSFEDLPLTSSFGGSLWLHLCKISPIITPLLYLVGSQHGAACWKVWPIRRCLLEQ